MVAAVPTTETEEPVRRFADQFITEHDDDAAEEFLAEDVRDYTLMDETTGRDAVVETGTGIEAALPDSNSTLQELVADGETVAARMIQRGTHDGVFM